MIGNRFFSSDKFTFSLLFRLQHRDHDIPIRGVHINDFSLKFGRSKAVLTILGIFNELLHFEMAFQSSIATKVVFMKEEFGNAVFYGLAFNTGIFVGLLHHFGVVEEDGVKMIGSEYFCKV